MYDASLRDEVTRHVDAMPDPTGRRFRLRQQGQPVPPSGKPAVAPDEEDDGVPTPWNDLSERPILERAALLSAAAGTGADPAALSPPARGWKDPKRLIDSLAFATALLPGIGDVAGLLSDAYLYSADPASRTPTNFGTTFLGMAPIFPGAAGLRMLGHAPNDLIERIAAKVPEQAAHDFRTVNRAITTDEGFLKSLREFHPSDADRIWENLPRYVLEPEIVARNNQLDRQHRPFLISRIPGSRQLDNIVLEADVRNNRIFIPSGFSGPAPRLLRNDPDAMAQYVNLSKKVP